MPVTLDAREDTDFLHRFLQPMDGPDRQAHTLDCQIDRAGSRRVHGHTDCAEVTVRGPRHPDTGMVLDLGVLRREIEGVRAALDHAFLDEVPGLGRPTLESLCAYIAAQLGALDPPVASVRVWREASGDGCTLRMDGNPRF